MALLCIKIIITFLGDVAQWESACIASRRSGVQIPSSPLTFKLGIFSEDLISQRRDLSLQKECKCPRQFKNSLFINRYKLKKEHIQFWVKVSKGL